ncbi:hypothetical protein [Hymenobacter ruricola]|uniref:Uncharacterized protein n=1 Tax=Hymenobacter ruricola TaxID=2791023 RepID=A0ABS0I0E7_9BACT|nr:hypothetical protein [Hymenobacter ruricola]MBF9220082.1 hypothetical protein [Hymenobacter ruricola]
MRIALLLLLLVLRPPAWGSQIVVGLNSDNLVSWSVWEREGTSLQHYLLLYNKDAQPVDVKIKLRQLAAVGTNFQNVPTNRTIFHVSVPARQLLRLKYPKKLLRSDYTEYFENDKAIGLLPAATAQPDQSVLNDSYRFYTDQGINARYFGYWVALESIDDLPRRIALTAAHRFAAPDETTKEEYHLVKLYPGLEYRNPRAGALDSVYRAGADASIIRLDAARPSAVVPVSPGVAATGFSVYTVYVEQINDGYSYDEAKRLVPNKSVGSSIGFLPVFPKQPKQHNGRRP